MSTYAPFAKPLYMAEYVSATLPIILKSSFLQQLWAL